MSAKPPTSPPPGGAAAGGAAIGGGGRRGRGRTGPSSFGAGRVLGVGALLLLALLAAGHLALWSWLAGRLEAGALAWAAARRAEGWRVEHGPPARGGWPTGVTLTVPALRLVRDGAAWEAPGGVVLRLSPPLADPRLTITAFGPQRLRLGGLDVPVEVEALRVGLPLQDRGKGAPGWPADATASAARLRLDLPGGALTVLRPRLELETRAGAGPGAPAVLLRGEAAEATLPADPALRGVLAALGPALRAIRLDLTLTGPLPVVPSPSAVAAWRDAGGTLEVRELALGWGPAAAAAAATLALDGAMQPAGAGTLRLVGGDAALEAAAASGALAPREAAAARLLLGLMQRRPADGAPPELEVPVTLERGLLSLARLPLVRVPPLAWPGAAAARAERR